MTMRFAGSSGAERHDSEISSPPRCPVPGPLPNTLLNRLRLLEMLNTPVAVTLVTAPAGFGKSTLVAQWVQQADQAIHWIPLQPEDNDDHRWQLRAHAALDDGLDCLVLDNAEVLTRETCRAFLDDLVNNLGSGQRVVIVARRPVGLRLSRLRATRTVVEIGIDDLRFSPDETWTLLKERNSTRLTREQIRALWSMTRGWVAGLMLAVAADETAPPMSGFTENEWKKWDDLLDDYYREEVIERLPNDIRTILYEFSDLPILTADLCAIARSDSSGSSDLHRLLQQVPDVMIRLPDDDGYLFKPLFSASLRRFAASHGVRPVDRCPAVRWLHETGNLRAAAGLALEGDDSDWIECTMQRLGESLVCLSHFDELILWMDRVPSDLVSRHPDFQYWRIVARLGQGRTFQVNQMIDTVAPGWIATGDPLHTGRASLLRGMLAYWEGSGSQASSQLALALEQLPPSAEMERLYAETYLGNQAFREGRDDDAEVPLRAAELKLRGQPIQAHWGWRTVAADRANAYAIRGDLHSATTKYRLMLEELPGPMPEIEGFLRCRLLALQVERGLLDEATANHARIEGLLAIDETHWQLEVGMARVQSMLAHRGDVVDWRHDAAIARTRMLLASGSVEEAETWASGYLKQVRHLPQKNQLVLLLAYMWLRRGELPMVRSWLRDVGPSPWPWIDQFGDINPLVLAIDLALAEKAFEVAASTAQAAVGEAKARRRWAEFVGLSVRLAIAQRKLGDREESSTHLEDALRRGLKGGFVQAFDVPGFTLAEVFREDWERIRVAPGIGEYIHLLPPSIAGEDHLLLTRREAEVLALVAEGKSNKEIATELFISVNTVRNHLVRMGKRLQAGSRTELVARARRVGLLD